MKSSLMLARAICLTSMAMGAALPAQHALASDQLTIVSWGGAFQDKQSKAFFQPFAASTGTKVTEGDWSGETAKIRAMVESKTVSWDVVDVGSAIDTICNAGIVETIDWSKVGIAPDKLSGKHECGVPTTASANIVAFDKDRLTNGPKTIADLFDLKKFPGKRGLHKDPAVNLEWALIADGVPIKDVYKVLSTPEGVDRAFKKLDTIKSDVVWWTTGAQPAQLLADGQVIMTSAWNGRIYDAVKSNGKHLEIMWDATLLNWDFWVIPKGTPRLDAAYKFIAFASTPAAQANMARLVPNAPSNTDTNTLLDPGTLSNLPTAPDHMKNASNLDLAFWGEKYDELNQRFTGWLAK